MNKISDPQYGDNFVGRGEKINELKEKIENNGIVVITGDRGIGKTNLVLVVMKEVEKEKECHHISKGSIFYDRMSEIFKPPLLSKIKGISSPLVGINWDLGKNPLLEYMVKSKERLIFVEDAQKLDRKAVDLIFDASRRNERLRFILEIATPYKPAEKLGRGPDESVEVKGLSNKSTAELLKGICLDLSIMVVRKIISFSRGYPYVAKSLAYICNNKNTEEEMLKFLEILRDKDMKYTLDLIHNDVLNTLSEDAEKVVKRLAIATPILTLKLIKAFCKDMTADLNTPFSELIKRGIIVKEGGNGKRFYRIYHPLFRDYLRSEDIQPMIIEDRKEYYRKAMEEVKAEPDSIYILLEVFNEPDIFKELIKRTENYVVINSIGSQAYTWGELEQALYAWNHLLERTKDKDKEGESTARGNIGLVYQIKGELDKALEYFRKALKLNEELGRKEGMAAGLGNIGTVYRIKGELDNALEYFGKALKLNEELGRKEGIAIQLGNIGTVYRIKGELDEALEYYGKALELDEEIERKEGIAEDFGNIGSVYKIKGELDNALEYYANALKLDEELGRKKGMANQLGNIGILYQIKGELDKALDYYGKALKLDEELGTKEGMAAGLGNIGSLYQIKGELDNALEYSGKALKLNEELGRKEGMAVNLVNIGNVYRIKGELDNALEYSGKALKLNEELGSKEGMAANLVNIGNVYQIKGELDNALEYYEKALKLNEELGSKEGMALGLGNIGNVYKIKGELDNALEYFENALKKFKDIGNRIETARTLMNIGDVFALKGDEERALDYYLEAQELAIGSSVFEEISKRINMLLGRN